MFMKYVIGFLTLCLSVFPWPARADNQASQLYEQAMQALAEKKDAEGELLLKASLQQAPDYLPALMTLADRHLKQRDFQSATLRYEAALQAGADPSLVVPALLESLFERGEFSRMAKWQTQHPNVSARPEAGYWLMQMYAADNQPVQAHNMLQRLQRDFPTHPLVLYTIGRRHLEQGQLLRATSVLAEMQQRVPEHPMTLTLAARLAWMQGNAEQARELFASLLDKQPGHIPALFAMVRLSQEAGAVTEAMRYLQQLQTLQPHHPMVKLLQLTMMGISRPDTETKALLSELEHQLSMVDHYHPTSFRAQLIRGFVSFLQNRYSDAIASLIDYLSREPDNAQARRLLIEAYWRTPQFAKAETHLATLLRDHPNDADAALLYAKLFQRKGEIERYQQLIEQGAIVHPTNDEFRHRLAALKLNSGNAAEARRLLASDLSDKDEQSVSFYLTQLLIRLDEAALAARSVEQLLSTYPQVAQSHYLAGEYSLAATHMDRAYQYFQQCLTLDPSFYPAMYRLIDIHIAKGEFTNAQQLLLRVLQARPNDIFALQRHAGILVQTQDYLAAIAPLERLQTLAPSVENALALSSSYWISGQQSQAISLNDDWLTRHPNEPKLLEQQQRFSATPQVPEATAMLNVALDSEEALSSLRQWLMDHPNAVEVARRVVAELKRQGRQEEVRDLLMHLYNKTLHHQYAHSLANILPADEQALALAQFAQAKVPNNAAYNDTLGWILVKRGEYHQGLNYLREAEVRVSSHPALHCHLAVVLHFLDRSEESVKYLETALSSGFNYQEIDVCENLSRERAKSKN